MGAEEGAVRRQLLLDLGARGQEGSKMLLGNYVPKWTKVLCAPAVFLSLVSPMNGSCSLTVRGRKE